jgi:hypothetical protein
VNAPVKHAERAHAECGASGAARWTQCAGSNWMLRRYPQPTSAAALEGTRAHEMLEARLRALPGVLSKAAVIAADPSSKYDLGGMYDYLNETVEFVASSLKDYPDAQLFIESKFELTEDIWGTNDVAIYIPSIRRLIVLDLKYGMKIVEAEGNMQTRIYAMGVIEVLRGIGLFVRPVQICISQPRCHDEGDGIRSEEVTLHDLFVFREFLERAVEKVKSANAFLDRLYANEENWQEWWGTDEWRGYFAPSEKACYFCAKAECPAYEKYAFESLPDISYYKDLMEWTPPDIETMDIDRLETIERNKDAILSFLKAVTKRLMIYGMQGRELKTMKVVQADARRSLIKNDELVAEWLEKISKGCLNKSAFYRQTFKGIADLETIILNSPAAKFYGDGKKAQRKAIKEAMAETIVSKRRSGKLSLVPLEDPRDAIETSIEDLIDHSLIEAAFAEDEGE